MSMLEQDTQPAVKAVAVRATATRPIPGSEPAPVTGSQFEESQYRSWGKALLFHIAIRVRYFFLSWGFLKPFLVKNLSAYPSRYRPENAPELDFPTMLAAKLLWTTACSLRVVRVAGFALVVTGIWHVLGFLHELVYRRVVRQARRSGWTKQNRERALPEYDWRNGSPEEFHELFVKRPHPVVLRGFMRDEALLERLTFEKVLATYGEETVLLTTQQRDGFPGKLKEVNDPSVYLHNSETLFNKYPELTRMLETPKLEPYTKQKRGYSQLFLGRQGTGSPFHSAAIFNMFYMIEGRKKWYFIDPYDTPLVYPIFALGSNSCISCCLYPDDFDEEAFPAFAYVPYFSTTLEPGDVLFNPPWWWHSIRNLTPTSVGVATRWHPGGIAGTNLMMTDENYDINRFGSFQFFVGPKGLLFLQRILQSPSPALGGKRGGKNTMREKGNRYVDIQYKLARAPGFRVLGYRFKF